MSVVLVVAVLASALAAGCGGGSSKPAYCSDRSALESSIQALKVPTSADEINGLKSQLTKIQSDATALVNSAKSDFPSETSAITSSIDSLSSAVDALPSSPSASDLATIGLAAAAVANSIKSFMDATSSNC
jgi:hypothetical protein